MKKIIYSLVIMIAAGSLFTSCVENAEPQGIKDLREAKADYLASLSKLREADAELVKAKAAYQSAQIAVVEADAALKQAEADIAQALADAAQLGVEYLDAKLQMQLEEDRVRAEEAVVKAQADLAQAQFDYDKKLRDLVAKSVGLNEEEAKALNAAVDSLESAQEAYHEAFVAVEKKKMDIWNKEYDHDSIGKGVVDWEAEIARAEASIASKEAKIADLKEMKEEPETIQAFLEAYQDSILEFRKDTLLAVQEKKLYEITVLNEANKAYGEKVEAFKESIPAAPEYLFADINSDEDTVAKSYPLSGTGEDLDALFASYVNELIKNESGNTAKDYKIGVKEDNKTIEVGGKTAAKADLDTATEILGTIVEALSRHLVVVDDSLKAKKLDTLKKEAAKADTAYWKARKALEAGFEGWDVAKDSLETLKAVMEAKKADYESVKTAHKNDTANLKANAKTLAKAYIDGYTKYADAVDRFNALAVAAAKQPSEYTMKATDTTAFLDAVKAYGTAQKNYVGVEDSLQVGNKNVPFSAMDSVRTTLLTVKLGNIKVGTTSLTYDKDAKYAFSNIIIGTDTVGSLKNYKNTASDVFNAGVKAISTAKTAYSTATAAYTGYDKAAKKDYIGQVYEPFFGVTVADADTAKALTKVKFTWDDETFSFKKEDCIVKFIRTGNDNDPDSIIPTNTLKIVLDGVDGQGYSAGTKFVNSSKIFKGEKATLFAIAIKANQLAKEAENFAFLKDQLDNIKTQYAAIVSDLKAYNDQYAEDCKANKAGLKALTGEESESAIVSTLSETNVKNGEWDLAGKQLEFANEVAAEYPAIVKSASDGVKAIKEKIDDTQDFIDFLETAYVEYKNLEEDKTYRTVEDIISSLDRQIGKLENRIVKLQNNIQQYKKNIAKIEAGYDTYTVELQSEYDQLAKLESELEIAEQKLKIAQAEYDAVIALYGINE